jgi:hypothetical protein
MGKKIQKKMRPLKLVFILFFGLTQAFGQGFKFAYKLDSISENAWYQINLSEHLRARSKIDLSDLRLVSGKDTFPYFIKEVEPSSKVQEVLWLNGVFESSHSYLVQTENNSINFLQLKVHNHKQTRRFSISGSNNKKDWFTISDQEALSGSAYDKELFYWQNISLPMVKYQYLRFKFLDTALESPRILSVIAPKEKEVLNGLQLITQLSYLIEALPEQQITRIKLFSSFPQWIHQLSFKISNPAFYYRRAVAYRTIQTKGRRGNINTRRESLGEFVLKSDQPNDISFEHYLSDTLIIDILNEDNPALDINNIICFQRRVSLFAHLNKARTYYLICGNANAFAPSYDIGVFESKVEPEKAKQIAYQMDDSYFKESVTATVPSFLESKMFLWGALVLAVLALLVFTSKLLKENLKT